MEWSFKIFTTLIAGFLGHVTAREIDLTHNDGTALPECTMNEHETGLFITSGCFDPNYTTAIIDSETDEEEPVPHHRISGHFDSNNDDFNIYLPPASKFDGRFFQLVYPTQNSSAEDHVIGFGVDSRGYTVQAQSFGYRGNAAVAKLSRHLAREYYKQPNSTIRGYVYGGSGGSLQTVGAAENTEDVWDGALILIQAVPFSNPNNWPIRALTGTVLNDNKEEVKEALRPGGSDEPFSVLPDFKRALLDESTNLGVPLRAWETFELTGQNRVQLWDVIEDLVIPQVKMEDPSYVDDFWNAPGYAGSEESELGSFFRDALVEFNATVLEVIYDSDNNPVSISLHDIPEGLDGVPGLEVALPPGNEGSERTFFGLFTSDNNSVAIPPSINDTWIPSLPVNATLKIDNRWWLAIHTLHRHQVPTPDFGLYGYDYLRDENEEPIYPQRDILIGPGISRSASGGAVHSGNITCKTFLMDTLLDADAFPWHADWYKKQVSQSLGDDFDDNFRLYFTDNADHSMGFVTGSRNSEIVDFIGAQEQHLRDLAAWVEKGNQPPKAPEYTVIKGQVELPDSAEERAGIQPVVTLTVNGNSSAEAKIGEVVDFSAQMEVPPNTGTLVRVEWDFEGDGTYREADIEHQKTQLEVLAEHTYADAGTYLPAVRVTAHREGDRDTTFALAKNLGRAQVRVA